MTAGDMNEALTSAILDLAHDAIIAIDHHGHIVLFNQGAQRIFGYDAAEVIGKPLDMLLPPGVSEAHRAHVHGFQNGTERSRRMDERRDVFGRRKDGTVFPVEASIANVSRDGETISVAILRDVTVRNQVNNILRRSETTLKEAQRVANIGSWQWDVPANRVEWSDQFHEILGLKKEDHGGTLEEFFQFVHPDDRERVRAVAERASKTMKFEPLDYRIVTPDGTLKHVAALQGAPVLDSDNNASRVFGIMQDISERKQVELSLMRSHQLLASSQRLGRLGSWEWDIVADVTEWSPHLYEIFGVTPDQFSPSAFGGFINCLHPDDRERVTRTIERCLVTQEVFDIDYRITCPGGQGKWIHAKGQVTTDRDGHPLTMVGTSQDITDRKQTETELRTLSDELHRLAGRLIETQDTERARIARDLHDDVGQRLAALSIALSGVKRKAAALGGGEGLEQELSSLQQRTVSLAESIRQLSHDLHPSALQHAGLVAAVAAYCANLGRQDTVALTWSAQGDFESIDPAAALCLYRVAQEALRNVVKHAGARHADVGLLRAGDQAEITIADDGLGFDVVKARNHRTGLGLVSINERVRLAGGTLSIVTELNKGTQVRVRIPANRRAETAEGDLSG